MTHTDRYKTPHVSKTTRVISLRFENIICWLCFRKFHNIMFSEIPQPSFIVFF